jgi:MoxR-like ATPase
MTTEVDQWKGCYGEKVSYAELDEFLEESFRLDDAGEEHGGERFATCIWGSTGLGKTSKIKQFANRPVTWRGKKYSGYDVRSVPIAQFEEMGDLHGMPCKHIFLRRDEEVRWVPIEVSREYERLGWKVDHSAGVKTMYAPPDWVPTDPGPCVLILDDFNRAGHRIIKGCMQLLQEYGLMSWRLPPGCHIVLTGNPDEQDYLVTTIDSAVVQRLRNCTLKFDAKEWSVWAARSGIDSRVQTFVLSYPEMAQGRECTSPRSLSEFGRYLSMVGAMSDDNIRSVQIMAKSLLDDETVSSILTFIDRDFEMVVSPEDIMVGKPQVYEHLKDMMTRSEKRIDVISVTTDRLFAHLSRPEIKAESNSVANVQKYLTSQYLVDEMRYVFVDRLNRASEDDPKMDKWFLGNRELTRLIMDVV